jgi:hypothetical protein
VFVGSPGQASWAKVGNERRMNEFESILSSTLGTAETIHTTSAYDALRLVLSGIEIAPGDEILVPSLSAPYIFSAIESVGAVAVICDVEEAHILLNVKDAQQRMTDKTKAMVYPHYTGRLSNIRKLYWLAENCNFRVIEDASHSIGCRWNNMLIGSFGDITITQFGEDNLSLSGGAVTSIDTALMTRMRAAAPPSPLPIDGVEKVRRFLEEVAPRRVAAAKRLEEKLRGMDGVTLVGHAYDGMIPYWIPVRANESAREKMLAEGGQQPYLPPKREALPVTEKLAKELWLLPVL